MNDALTTQHKGIIHLAFETVTKEEVNEKARLFAANGFRILDGPRVTGDGYYEFVTHDPEYNRIEITTAYRI
jgi:lactoylglutathione lyase